MSSSPSKEMQQCRSSLRLYNYEILTIKRNVAIQIQLMTLHLGVPHHQKKCSNVDPAYDSISMTSSPSKEMQQCRSSLRLYNYEILTIERNVAIQIQLMTLHLGVPHHQKKLFVSSQNVHATRHTPDSPAGSSEVCGNHYSWTLPSRARLQAPYHQKNLFLVSS